MKNIEYVKLKTTFCRCLFFCNILFLNKGLSNDLKVFLRVRKPSFYIIPRRSSRILSKRIALLVTHLELSLLTTLSILLNKNLLTCLYIISDLSSRPQPTFVYYVYLPLIYLIMLSSSLLMCSLILRSWSVVYWS